MALQHNNSISSSSSNNNNNNNDDDDDDDDNNNYYYNNNLVLSHSRPCNMCSSAAAVPFQLPVKVAVLITLSSRL
jgi:hypothetical protein